jgi:hypothetical protein
MLGDLSAPNLRPTSRCSGFGMMVPANWTAKGDSGGTSAGLPVKSMDDDAIGPGELLALVALALGHLVEAHPATTTRANNHTAARQSGFMTRPPTASLHRLQKPGKHSSCPCPRTEFKASQAQLDCLTTRSSPPHRRPLSRCSPQISLSPDRTARRPCGAAAAGQAGVGHRRAARRGTRSRRPRSRRAGRGAPPGSPRRSARTLAS